MKNARCTITWFISTKNKKVRQLFTVKHKSRIHPDSAFVFFEEYYFIKFKIKIKSRPKIKVTNPKTVVRNAILSPPAIIP